MGNKFDDDVRRLQAELDAKVAANLPVLPKQPQQLTRAERFARVSLGRDGLLGEDLTLDEKPRLSHSHTIGTTGAGKTIYLAHLIKQDIARGRGVMLLDPHGNSPMSPLASESLFSTIVEYCDSLGLIAAGRVHIIDPARNTHAVGFNPIAARPGFASDVIANMMIQCVERVWKQDTHDTPTLRTTLRASIIALSELGLTLNEMDSLLNEDDADGLRRHAIATIKNDYARTNLQHIQDLSQRRNKSEFEIAVVGPRNRINEFTSNDAIKAIIGQTSHLLDMVEVMDKRNILLVNLQPTGKADDEPMRLLGTMLLRYLLALAPERTNKIPFFVYVDECQNYLSGDVPALLREVRKRRVGLHLAHQDLAALETAGPDIKGALFANTNVKTFFRLTSTDEARQVVDNFFPSIDYEMPVQILIKPTVVGHEIIRLESQSTAVNSSDTEGEGENDGHSHAHGKGEADTFSEMAASTDMTGSADSEISGLAFSDSLSQSILPDTSLFGASVPVTIGTPTPNTTGMTASQISSRSNALSRSNMNSHADTIAAGRAKSYIVNDVESLSRTLSKSRGHTDGVTTTRGWSESLRPIFEKLPTAVHAPATVIDMIARTMLRLAPGEAYVTALGRSTRITVPFVAPPELPPAKLTAIITKAFDISRYTTSAVAIAAAAELRTSQLKDATTPETRKVKHEPDITTPESWGDLIKDQIPIYPDPPPMPQVPTKPKSPAPPKKGKPDLTIVKKSDDDDDEDPPPAAA